VVAFLGGSSESVENPLQLVQGSEVSPLDYQARRPALDRRAQIVDLPYVFRRQLHDERPPSRLLPYQSLGCEPPERLPDRAAADLELPGDGRPAMMLSRRSSVVLSESVAIWGTGSKFTAFAAP
jgi:hypothetical protein